MKNAKSVRGNSNAFLILNSEFSILNYVTSFHDFCRDSG